MKNCIKISFLVLILIGCTKKENVEDELYKLVKNPRIDNTIIVVSDTDCAPCLLGFVDYKNSKTKNYYGYFISHDETLFKEKLIKVNSNIDWYPLRDLDLLVKLEKKYNKTGPYIIDLKKKGANIN